MRKNFTEREIITFASVISKTVVIRSFVDGNSSDIRRESTEEEAALIERAIAAALLSIRDGRDISTAKSTAEYFVFYNSGETLINTYSSVYIPIGDFLELHE